MPRRSARLKREVNDAFHTKVRAEALRLYQEGYSYDKIAILQNVSTNCARDRVLRASETKRQYTWSDPLERRLVRTLYKQGKLSIEAIALQFNRATRTIHRWIHEGEVDNDNPEERTEIEQDENV